MNFSIIHCIKIALSLENFWIVKLTLNNFAIYKNYFRAFIQIINIIDILIMRKLKDLNINLHFK